MHKIKKYKTAIWILSFLVAIEGMLVAYLLISRPKKPPYLLPGRQARGKIAIVVDDWGYNLNNLYLLDGLNYPLTMSVLPGLAFSRAVAEELQRRGFQIILHLPMEPKEKYRLEENTIMTSMDESRIRDILSRDLNNLPYAKGVSNHMGSRATEDLKTMEIIFAELKKRRLYFLDSLVSGGSVGLKAARKMKVGFARRDVFLDNQHERGYIIAQINRLKARAEIYGQAIGIGHDHKLTLEVLKEIIPKLEKDGYKLVFVSELIH